MPVCAELGGAVSLNAHACPEGIPDDGRSGHFALAAAIDQRYVLCAESLGGIRSVDRGVSAPDHYHAAPQRDAALGLVIGDEAEGVDYARQVFAGDVQGAGGAESDG